MAQKIGSMYADLTVNAGPYVAGMALAERATARAAGRIRRETGIAQTSIERFTRSTSANAIRPYGLIAVSRAFERVNDRVSLLRGTMLATTAVFGGFAAALSSNLVLRYADTFTNLSNQIRVVSDDSIDLAGQIAAVSAAADRSRGSLQATATLYSRLAKAAPSRESAEILGFVETIQKALALGGATAQEAASAAIQFSQAIASNRLGGEELRAVLETPLGLALAKGLDVTIGKLREMSIAGELTADRVLGALSRIKGDVDEQFSKSVLTIDQSLVQADNRLTDYVGSLDKTYGLTRLVSGSILGFANNIDLVATSVGYLAVALGSAFGGRLLGGNVGKAIDATFGEVGRLAKASTVEVQKLTQVQSELADKLQKRSRALNNLSGQSNTDFASPSDLKRVQREEARLNALRDQRLASTIKLKNATAAAFAVEVKASKASQNAAARIVETQDKIAEGTKRQADLTQSLTQAETRLTAAKSQQVLNTSKISAVAESERDILRIRNAQVAETAKVAKLESGLATQRITLASKIGDDEARAVEQRARAQAQVRTFARENFSLQRQEFEQTQRLGKVKAAVAEVGALGKSTEIRVANAELDGLRTRLDKTTASLGMATRGTSIFRQSIGLLGRGAGSLVGFLGGPWGVAFTAAIAGASFLGFQLAKTAAQAERTKKSLDEVLTSVGKSGAKAAPVAQSAVESERIKGELEEVGSQVTDFRAALEHESLLIAIALTNIFDPLKNNGLTDLNHAVAAYTNFSSQIVSLIDRASRGEVAFDKLNAEIRAIPEAKFLSEEQIADMTTLVEKSRNLTIAMSASTDQAKRLGDALKSGLGNLKIDEAINASGRAAVKTLEDYEANLKASLKIASNLVFEFGKIAKASELENKIRDRTAKLMEANEGLMQSEAREIATVNTVLEIINSRSDEWLRSTEATKGEFAQLLAIAKQVAPAIDFSKQSLDSTQLAAISDMLAKQSEIGKKVLNRTLLGERENAILEKQEQILASIRDTYGTIEGINLQSIRETAASLVDFDQGAAAIGRADAVLERFKVDTADLGIVAAASTNTYIRSLNGVGGVLEQFRAQQASVVAQFVENRQQTTDVTSSLAAYRSELSRLISTSSQNLFGDLERTPFIREELDKVSGSIINLARRFEGGKMSGSLLVKEMSAIEEKLRSLGADTDALGPFINNILTAISKVSELLRAIGLLKKEQTTLGGGRAGTTGTMERVNGVNVHRFGGDNDNGANEIVRSVNDNGQVVGHSVDRATDAIRGVNDGVGTLDQNLGGHFDSLGNALSSSLGGISSGFTNLADALHAINQAGGHVGRINYTDGADLGLGGGFITGKDSDSERTSYGIGTGWGDYDMPESSTISDTTELQTVDGDTSAIKIDVVVKPVMEGTRLSGRSRAEIRQAAAEGANAALRAYNGR